MNDFLEEKINELAYHHVVAMINSECALLSFLHDHPLCVRDEFASDEESKLYDDIKLKHDNDFCRVREMLREIQNDESLLLC